MENSSIFKGYVLLEFVQFLVSISAAPLCDGGLSVRGLRSSREFDAFPQSTDEDGPILTASCCETSGQCYGGYIIDHLPMKSTLSLPTIESSLIPKRHKRSSESCPVGCVQPSAQVCQSEGTVFFPISAVSAITHERVTVLQVPPLLFQGVVFQKCSANESAIFNAQCHQLFTPEVLYIVRVNANSSNAIEVSREPVFVENGCASAFTPIIIETNVKFDNSVLDITAFLRG